MFDPDIFGFSSSALWSFTQILLMPTLGFLFVYLMRIPIAELPWLPGNVKYTPPTWVLPIVTHGLAFALIATISANLFLNGAYEKELTDTIKPELFITRELDVGGNPLANAAIVVNQYDGFSNFRIFANGYHVFSSDRDCVAKFQCTSDRTQSAADLAEFKKLRVSGGSVYDLSKTNSLPHEVVLNHYLAEGDNYVDVISENSGTGACELDFDVALVTIQNAPQRYHLHVLPQRGGTAPPSRRLLATDEVFYSAGQSTNPDTVKPYNTSAHERPNIVCERIRISLKLPSRVVQSDEAFRSHFLDLQKAYVCETIGGPRQGCEARQ